MKRWQLRQMCFPAGQHLAKFPTLPKEGFVPRSAIITPYSGGYGTAWVNPSRKGNLENEEYRFFMGSPMGSTTLFSQCRICNLTFYSVVTRREHLQKSGCSKTAVRAFMALLSKGQCVICAKPVTTRKWGVPLCPGEALDTCIDRWKFYQLQPPLLKAVLPEVKRDESIFSAYN